MSEYIDHHARDRAFATSHPINRFNDMTHTINTAVIEWAPVLILWVVVSWVCTHYYMTANLSRKIERFIDAVYATARPLAKDFALFVLTILAIIAEVFLQTHNACSAKIANVYASICRHLAPLKPVVTQVYVQYDAANHGHLANLTRQRLRAIRAAAGTALRWAALISVVVVILGASPAEEVEDTGPQPKAEALRYVIPDWVIRARPENRPYFGSSSHYRPESDCACKRDVQSQEEATENHHDDRNVAEDPPISSSRASRSSTRSIKTTFLATRVNTKGLESLSRLKSSTSDVAGDSKV